MPVEKLEINNQRLTNRAVTNVMMAPDIITQNSTMLIWNSKAAAWLYNILQRADKMTQIEKEG